MYRQYFLMQQTLKLNNEKQKKSSFCEVKSLVGLTPDFVASKLNFTLLGKKEVEINFYLCHFSSQSLLNLEPSGIDLHNSGQLAQTQNLVNGQVSNAHFPVKWNL